MQYVRQIGRGLEWKGFLYEMSLGPLFQTLEKGSEISNYGDPGLEVVYVRGSKKAISKKG